MIWAGGPASCVQWTTHSISTRSRGSIWFALQGHAGSGTSKTTTDLPLWTWEPENCVRKKVQCRSNVTRTSICQRLSATFTSGTQIHLSGCPLIFIIVALHSTVSQCQLSRQPIGGPSRHTDSRILSFSLQIPTPIRQLSESDRSRLARSSVQTKFKDSTLLKRSALSSQRSSFQISRLLA